MKHLKNLLLAAVAMLGLVACTPGEFEAKQYVYFWVQNNGTEAVMVEANTQSPIGSIVCEPGEKIMIDVCEGKKVEGLNNRQFVQQNYDVPQAERWLKVSDLEGNVKNLWKASDSPKPEIFKFKKWSKQSQVEGTADWTFEL